MKKILALLMGMLFIGALTACNDGDVSQNSNTMQEQGVSMDEESMTSLEENLSAEESSSGDSQTTQEKHPHYLKRMPGQSAKCDAQGNILHWYCEPCDMYFADANGLVEISYEDTLLEIVPHSPVIMAGRDATCDSAGKYTSYLCSKCSNLFLDEACTERCTEADLIIDSLPHNMTYHQAVVPAGQTDGVKEHWRCNICENAYADEVGTELIMNTVWYSTVHLVDFVVEVPKGRDPVVLQLSDTQIIDASQERPGRGGVLYDWWATDKMDERCFDFVRETIEATNPDFIIITGDVVYGEFDDNGSVWLKFIEFMESFQIPWSPVFGNHDNESYMGVDWQCRQLENAKYCLFEQKALTGNGNYSVGIMQDDELKRVFYMLDSNGCGGASAQSLANGHTKTSKGFGQDQIDWYTEEIIRVKDQVPEIKISFAYHIQQAVFADAYKQYGFNQSNKYQNINLETIPNKAEGDFGHIGRQMKDAWDENKSIYNGMKALGVDSILVGHEHCNSVSVVYDGVRFQYGQKSSQYDRFNYVTADGAIAGDYQAPAGATSLIGGTVMVLSKEDGQIKDAYIYYCEEAGGKIDWSQFIVYEVNGLQKSDMTAEGGISMVGKPIDGQINAYEIIANEQGKIFINTELLRGKSMFTFTVYIDEITAHLVGYGPYAIRIKANDDGKALGIAGAISDGQGKYYIDYDVDSVEAVRVQVGTWQTFTVDISGISEVCSEFAILLAKGNTIYLRDMIFA